jgi:hypothetical protein
MIPKPTSFVTRWLPEAPKPPDGVQVRIIHPQAPRPARVRPKLDAADLDTLLQPVGVRGEFLLAQVTFPTLANLAVGVTSAGNVLPDPGADRELLAAALRRVLDLLRPEPAPPPPRPWWRRWFRA